MRLKFDGQQRETLTDPVVKKIDANGKAYIGKRYAGKEVLIVPLVAMPEDKIKWLRVGR